MKYNPFDVVELNNNEKAIMISVTSNFYNVKIFTPNNESKLIQIKDSDIKRTLYQKKN